MDLTDKDRELVNGKNFAYVSTLLPDGAPEATVVWVDEREGCIRFNSSESSVKAKNVRRDPRVAVSVHDQADPYVAVTFRGRAEITTEGADAHIDELTRKLHGQGALPGRVESRGRSSGDDHDDSRIGHPLRLTETCKTPST
jgi:PPOX class probable F420-dependent enzyme